jgi:hypothetical protein
MSICSFRKMFSCCLFFFMGQAVFIVCMENKSISNKIEYEHETLSSWTNACFQKCPDLFENNKSPLNANDFKKCLKKYTEKMKLDEDFNNKDCWVDGQDPNSDYYEDESKNSHPYVMKKETNEEVKVFIMGDIHGGIQSLLRCLWRLVILGYLDNNFNIVNKKKLYMVFLGDYMGRGSFELEVLYTLCRLKLANWNNVFILTGNHEETFCFVDFKHLQDFKKEDSSEIETFGNYLYKYFPFALFFNKFQLSHGGIGHESEGDTLKKPPSPYDTVKLFSNTNFKFQKIALPLHNSLRIQGFSHNDFDGVDDIFLYNAPRGFGFINGYKPSMEYFEKQSIKGIIRGHQHFPPGIKVINEKGKTCLNYLDYPAKNLSWNDSMENIVNLFPTEKAWKFNIQNQCYKIFTITNVSSMPNNNNMDHDFFCILNPSKEELEIFGEFVEKEAYRKNKFVAIDFFNEKNDPFIEERGKQNNQVKILTSKYLENGDEAGVSTALVTKADQNTEERIKSEKDPRSDVGQPQIIKQRFTLSDVIKKLCDKLNSLKKALFVKVLR